MTWRARGFSLSDFLILLKQNDMYFTGEYKNLYYMLLSNMDVHTNKIEVCPMRHLGHNMATNIVFDKEQQI